MTLLDILTNTVPQRPDQRADRFSSIKSISTVATPYTMPPPSPRLPPLLCNNARKGPAVRRGNERGRKERVRLSRCLCKITCTVFPVPPNTRGPLWSGLMDTWMREDIIAENRRKLCDCISSSVFKIAPEHQGAVMFTSVNRAKII